MRQGERLGGENRRNQLLIKCGAIIGTAAALLTLAACDNRNHANRQSPTATATAGESAPTAQPEQLTTEDDGPPYLDWQRVEKFNEGFINKACDGTTLLYYFVGHKQGGLTAVPNSPECGYVAPEQPTATATVTVTATPEAAATPAPLPTNE